VPPHTETRAYLCQPERNRLLSTTRTRLLSFWVTLNSLNKTFKTRHLHQTSLTMDFHIFLTLGALSLDPVCTQDRQDICDNYPSFYTMYRYTCTVVFCAGYKLQMVFVSETTEIPDLFLSCTGAEIWFLRVVHSLSARILVTDYHTTTTDKPCLPSDIVRARHIVSGGIHLSDHDVILISKLHAHTAHQQLNTLDDCIL